jgi:hypothetical protein
MYMYEQYVPNPSLSWIARDSSGGRVLIAFSTAPLQHHRKDIENVQKIEEIEGEESES